MKTESKYKGVAYIDFVKYVDAYPRIQVRNCIGSVDDNSIGRWV